MDYFVESERIYSPKTREYFREVVSSYSNGNYRSAIVMLYSVCICDLLFKLQELRDMYNDVEAKSILSDIEKTKTSSNSKSSWEKELVEKIKAKTNLLDTEAYANLSHLYDYRNLSAHPALNGELELISPPKEIVAAYIRTSLDSILFKPSIFVKNVIELMSNDLDEKKDYIHQDKDIFENFMRSKYLDRMPDAIFQKTFRIFWRFTFRSVDAICASNRKVNVKVLKLMYALRSVVILKEIKENPVNYEITSDNSINIHIIKFLANVPSIYTTLPDHTKTLIKTIIGSNNVYKLASWFMADKSSHLKSLIGSGQFIFIDDASFVHFFFTSYENEGLGDECLEYMILVAGQATRYINAGERMERYIQPYLDKMKFKHFELLFGEIENCESLYNNNWINGYCAKIWKYAESTLPSGYDMTKHPHFKIPVKE